MGSWFSLISLLSASQQEATSPPFRFAKVIFDPGKHCKKNNSPRLLTRGEHKMSAQGIDP